MEESTGDVDDSFGLLGDEDEVSEAGMLQVVIWCGHDFSRVK